MTAEVIKPESNAMIPANLIFNKIGEGA